MTFSRKRQRQLLTCMVCGFKETAAIHQPPPDGPRKGSRLHQFQPKPVPHERPVKVEL